MCRILQGPHLGSSFDALLKIPSPRSEVGAELHKSRDACTFGKGYFIVEADERHLFSPARPTSTRTIKSAER